MFVFASARVIATAHGSKNKDDPVFIMSMLGSPLIQSATYQCQPYDECKKNRVKNLTGIHKCRSCLSLEASTGQIGD